MARYINSVPQILDANGDPIVGAKKHFYEPGTTTPKTIYSDSALTTPTANPAISDSAGRFDNIFLDGTYKEVQSDENDVTLWTRDPVGDETTGAPWQAWDAGTTYDIDNIVYGSNGEYYRSLANSNVGNDPTSSPASWEQLYLGRIWNANVTYTSTDTAYGSDGLLYKSQINSNLNNDPTTDHINWWPGSPEHLFVTASGTNTYAATYGETAYKTNTRYYITFTNANTAASPTLSLDAIGYTEIKGVGGTTLGIGTIPAGHKGTVIYDGTYFILLNAGGLVVSGDDTNREIIEEKAVATDASIVITTTNPGANEKLSFGVGTVWSAHLENNFTRTLKNIGSTPWYPVGWYVFMAHGTVDLELRNETDTWFSVNYFAAIGDFSGAYFCDGTNVRLANGNFTSFELD